MASKEYYTDVVLTKEISEWLLLQGATVHPSSNLPEVNMRGEVIADTPIVMFGHRQIHFWAKNKNGHQEARIFFTEETRGTALILMLKWPEAIFQSNLPKEWA